MASSKIPPGVTSRGRQAPPPDDPLTVSRARWLGVALVVGALVAAMVMAMTSRAEPGEDPPSLGASVAASPTPSPVPVASGEGVPTELPMIALDSELPAGPSGGLVTKKPDASLKITVPETVIRTRELKLESPP